MTVFSFFKCFTVLFESYHGSLLTINNNNLLLNYNRRLIAYFEKSQLAIGETAVTLIKFNIFYHQLVHTHK